MNLTVILGVLSSVLGLVGIIAGIISLRTIRTKCKLSKNLENISLTTIFASIIAMNISVYLI